MERLGGLDSAFLSFETPTMHMHVCGLLVIDSKSMIGGYSFARIRQMLLERAPLIPSMRRRLVPVPLNLSHPYWIEDGDFDLDYHLRRIAVPAPGGDRELAEICGDIASRPLDRDKPLWEMWVIEGCADDRVAIFAKMHHSTIDGTSGANMMFYMFDLEPEPSNPPAQADPWTPERRPSDLSLLSKAAIETVTRPWGIVKLTPKTLLRAGNLLLSARSGKSGTAAAPFTAPRTSFNASVTPHRTVAYTDVLLEDVKTVKEHFGVKVNDVVTAVVGGALRSYLQDRDELPDKPLISAVPVSVHQEAADTAGNAKVSLIFSNLATDVADPAERLRVIAESNADAKEVHKMVGADTLMQWADYAAPNMFSLAARLYSGLGLADRHPVIHNLIVSNVPGPPIPLYFAGARLTAIYPLGPILDGAGVNITVLSNEDRICFGIIACRELMPEPWALTEALHVSLAELVAVARPASRPAASKVSQKSTVSQKSAASQKASAPRKKSASTPKKSASKTATKTARKAAAKPAKAAKRPAAKAADAPPAAVQVGT